MELRSTRDLDINNPATLSMLEYLRKKGIETMSGTCKYPESVCPHMTVLKGTLHCDTTPCQLMGEFLRQSNAERIREMTDEELAKFLSEFSACQICEHFDRELDRCGANGGFLCVKEYAEAIIGDWLNQPVEE